MKQCCAVAFIVTVLVGGSVAIAETHVVTVAPSGSMTFSPSALSIANGDTVRWQWAASGHTVTSGTPGDASGAFDSGLNGTGAIFEVVFDQAFLDANPAVFNSYDYYCIPHGFFGMVGTVSVAGSGTGTSDAADTIPTLGEWGVILTGILLLFVGAYFIRRQRQDGASV